MNRTRTLLTLVTLLLLSAVPLFAQVATPSNHFAWSEVGQAAPAAQVATYNLYVDGSAFGTPLLSVTCTANLLTPANADCLAPIPAMTLGLHVVTLTQVITGAESPKSSSLSFTFVIVVTPTSLSVK